MPIPKPRPDEKEDEYVGRCMEAIGGEYKDDEDQAVAICHATFKEQRKKAMNEQLLEAIRQRQAKATEFGYGILTADRYVKNVLEAVGLDKCYKFAATRTVSWDDVMQKAARTLVYSNTDMITEEIEYSKRAGSSLKELDGIELPKNCLMVFRHVLTTPRKDRDGDVLRTKGAKVDPKLLLLWNHVHTIPVGKMLQVAEHNEKKLSLISCIVDELPMAHDCAVMIDNGMGRFSHGFRAIQFNKIKARDGSEAGGFDVTDFEIMEASLVSVPSNTDAEVEEVMLGLVEGGKLTSPLMKEYGRSIRSRRPLQVAGGLDLAKVSLPIDLKITLNGKEISNEDVEGAGVEAGAGAAGEGKNAAGLAKKADGGAAADKAEEATTDEKVKCPECGAMMARSVGAECPKCGYVLKKGDVEEDEVEEDELEEKSTRPEGTKFGRTFSRKNLTALKEVHADVEELDRGDHVLSVRGREITKGCRTKLKTMIDEHDIPDEGGVEEGKSFEKGDAPGHPFRGNQFSGGGGSSEGGESSTGRSAAASAGKVASRAAALASQTSSSKKGEIATRSAAKVSREASEASVTAENYPKSPNVQDSASRAHARAARAHDDAIKVHQKDPDTNPEIIQAHTEASRLHREASDFYGSRGNKSFGVEDAMAVLIAEATPAQRNTIRKAFDSIERVEQKNAMARQYRSLVRP